MKKKQLIKGNQGAGTIEQFLDGYSWAVNNATKEGKTGTSHISVSLSESSLPPSSLLFLSATQN